MSTATIVDDRGLGYLLDNFVEETDRVRFAHAVSADGMHLAASAAHDRETYDTFAAIVSGLTSLTTAAIDLFQIGVVQRQIIEATGGWILICRISDTAAFGVVTEADADLGLVGYEMTRVAQQVGAVLSPEVVDQLKHSLQV